MSCGCGGGRKTSATGSRITGMRGIGSSSVSTPRQGRIVTPRIIPPTMVRQSQMQAAAAQVTPAMSMARREVERKRRLAILKAQGK